MSSHLAARELLLYLLSLHAVTHALAAWDPSGAGRPVALLAWAAGLALATLLAAGPGARLALGLESLGRGRVRVALETAYYGLALLAPPVLAADPMLAPREARLFAALQPALLLAAASERGRAACLTNALVLVVLAGLRGGAIAMTAIPIFLGLVVVLLTLERWIATLSAYPLRRVPPVRAAIAEAVPIALVVMALALFAFALLPPLPVRGASLGSVTRGPLAAHDPQVAAAYRVLVLAAILGGLGVLGAIRLFRKSPKADAPSVESLETLPLADEALPEPEPPLPAPGPGPRDRVVRAYLLFLREAARLVARRRPSQTPREFARQVPEPAGPLAALTELFMRARYGAGEPSEADARAAEAGATAVIEAMRRPRRGLSAGARGTRA